MWKQLTPESLLSRIAGAEKTALERAATASGQPDPLGEIAASIAATWRGALRRVTTLDRRPLALPDEIEIHVLADFRYRAWTRLPGMSAFLDENRIREWELSQRVLANLKTLTFAPPDPEHTETTSESGKPTPQISNPDLNPILGGYW